MRIVVKVGTSSLCDDSGQLKVDYLQGLSRQLQALHDAGVEIVVVSSGAVGAGIGAIGLRPESTLQKQALAAIGQGRLMAAYQSCMANMVVGQVLVTRADLTDSLRSELCRQTLEQLIAWQVLPIINENDTVADEEIRIGDNDTLAARVAVLMAVDWLIILSDVDGLYTANPRQNAQAVKIGEVAWVTADHLRQYGQGGGQWGTGGMLTKLQAAVIAQKSGIPMVLADSQTPDVLRQILGQNGQIGTRFLADKERDPEYVSGIVEPR